MKEVFDVGLDVVYKIRDTQGEVLNQANKLIANAFIVQAINVQCAKIIAEAGVNPPVFVCPTIMGSSEKNKEYYEKLHDYTN